MTDTLSRVIGPVNVGSGSSTIFTGTTGHVYTLKKFKIVNNTAAAIQIKLGIGGTADANLITPNMTIAAGGFALGEEIEVLTGVETLQAVTSASGLTFSASGLDQGP